MPWCETRTCTNIGFYYSLLLSFSLRYDLRGLLALARLVPTSQLTSINISDNAICGLREGWGARHSNKVHTQRHTQRHGIFSLDALLCLLLYLVHSHIHAHTDTHTHTHTHTRSLSLCLSLHTPKVVDAFAKAVAESDVMQTFDISLNDVRDRGASRLAKYVTHCTRTMYIHLLCTL